jgi:drug/metabolite transporter (DMT)-like permease
MTDDTGFPTRIVALFIGLIGASLILISDLYFPGTGLSVIGLFVQITAQILWAIRLRGDRVACTPPEWVMIMATVIVGSCAVGTQL